MNRMNHAAPHRFAHALAVPLLVGGVFVGGAFQMSYMRNGADVCATALPGSASSPDLQLLAMPANPDEPAPTDEPIYEPAPAEQHLGLPLVEAVAISRIKILQPDPPLDDGGLFDHGRR